MNEECKVSLVLPTYNGMGRIEQCLASVKAQDVAEGLFELIVVNDGSTDETGKWLDLFALDASFPVTILHQDNMGVSSARNRGIEVAEGPLLAFCDDDCLLPSDWLSRIAIEFGALDDSIVGLGGPLENFTDSEDQLIGRYIKYLDEFNYIPVMGSTLIRPVHVSRLNGYETIPYLRTSNAAFRKEALVEIGGFDHEFRRPGGEDPDLSYRLLEAGYKLKFLPSLIVAHHTRDSFAAYFRSMKNYVCGEFRKSQKKELYRNPIIKRTYSFLVFQKMASSLLALFGYPLNCFRVKEKGFCTSDALLFPLLIVSSKFYALWVTICCQTGLLRPK